MPERDKQTDAIARTLAGAGPRPPLDRLGTKPAEVSDEQWAQARATADRVWVDTMQAIDFQRVLIEAVKRHTIVHPDKSTFMAAADIGFGTAEALCHECITEVMLATETNPPWSEQEESPRYLIYRDPHDSVAALVTPSPVTPVARTILGAPAAADDVNTGPTTSGPATDDYVAIDPLDGDPFCVATDDEMDDDGEADWPHGAWSDDR